MARILIVEDERSLAAALKRGLEDERHIVDVEHAGDDGLRAAELEPYDVLVLDIMLPGMSGLDITRALRRKRAATPILLLTAKDTTDDIVAGLDAGADDYLTKPFAFAVLLARIRTLLRRGAGSASPSFKAGAVELDAAAHKVLVAGAPVDLTVKEFQLLEVLLRRKGAVLSKAQLVEAAWSRDASPESNAIEVHIAGLRKKLDAAAAGTSALIHTVRGVGYVLREDES